VPVVVSPKLQEKVNGPTPPVVVAVNWTATPTSGVAGANVKAAAVSRGATTTDLAGEVALAAALSVTVTVTMKVPEVAYACVAGLPVPVVVSPKFHAKVNGAVPPLTVAVKLTVVPTSGFAGVTVVMVTDRAPETVTVCAGDVTDTLFTSVTLTVTLNVPAEV
jgi:hypothetical protein